MQHPEPGDDVLPELRDYPPTLTVQQLAYILNVRARTAQRIAEMQLHGIKAGGQWRVRRAEVQRLLLGQVPPMEGEDEVSEDD